MPEIHVKEMEASQGEPGLNHKEIEENSPSKPKTRRRLKVAHPERCIGCLGCMFACSRIRTGTVSLDRSAIKVQTQGGIEGDFRVVVCRAC
ncbi:MAG: 4Fe-4S ferredoxin iron-sulfur binding domain-containing protein, partial [Methanosaeta sp. NSM2]